MTGGFPPGFQWDEAKNRINIREHKIAFQDAVRIFEKPTLDEIDDRIAYGEERINSLGELDGRVILNVTHVERNGDIRLISARPAKKQEQAAYREFLRDLAAEPQPRRSIWDDDISKAERQVSADGTPENSPDNTRRRKR